MCTGRNDHAVSQCPSFWKPMTIEARCPQIRWGGHGWPGWCYAVAPIRACVGFCFAASLGPSLDPRVNDLSTPDPPLSVDVGFQKRKKPSLPG